jgi:hypothetical protein
MRDTSAAAGPRASGPLARGGAVGLLTLTALATAACSGGRATGPGLSATRTSSSTAPTPSPTPSPTSTRVGNRPLVVFYQTTPQAELSAVPAGARLVPLDSAASTRDGRTLYLGFESDSGKCGTYEVVLEPSRTDMGAGVEHLAGHGQACVLHDTDVQIVVKLPEDLDMRPVRDLATGRLVVAEAG